MVIYSADIVNVEESVDAGTIKYKIEPFYIKKLNGDDKYKYLKGKIENNEMLIKEDILNLTFLPLMSGSDSSTERAVKGIELEESIKDKETKMLSLSLLYALFEKFGETKGKAEMFIKLLMKKFKKLPDEYKNKIRSLSEGTLETIATDIFDLEKVEDLERYF